jgi:hypothetical protein
MQSVRLPIRATALLLACSMFFTACVSTTVINSNPKGARLYLDGEPVGTTPYQHSDTKIIGSTTMVRLEADGYETFHGQFTRDEEVDAGAVVGGIFVLFPFLWTMKYKPSRTFEMIPLGGYDEQPAPAAVKPAPAASVTTAPKSNVERLRELKQMLDEKLITQQEYDAARKKILEDIK